MDSQNTLSVNCNHCGAVLEVDENTRFVTCNYCHSRLAIQSTGSAVFTQVLEKLEERTGQIAGNLKVITKQNELEQLDREWTMAQESLMVSGRNGGRETPSTAGGIVGIIIAVVFGGGWTILVVKIGAPVFMVLFGLVVIMFGIFAGLNALTKAGELGNKRAEYESRRQQLIAEIESEKNRAAA